VLSDTRILTSLIDLPVLFVDCQTTGATPGSAHLLEVGWLVASAGQAADVQNLVTRIVALPEDQILPNRIQKITGISDEDLAGAVSAQAVCDELQEVLSRHNLDYAVAHWAQFERTFLTHYFENISQKQLAVDFICTCQIAKRLYPDLPSRAIRAVAGYFGLNTEEMKRAGGHVETTYFIWQKLVPELDQLGLKNAGDLVEWLKVKTPVKRAGAKETKGNTALLPLERLIRLELPDQPGVYRMLNRNGKILYVGKATSLKSRVNSYFTGRKVKDSKTKELISQVFDLDVSPVATPFEAALLENDLIKEHDPPYNRALKKRGRALIYFNRDFTSVSAKPDSEHVLGPFSKGSTIEPLILLVQGLQAGSFDPGLFWGLLDQEQTDRAVKLFFAEDQIDIEGENKPTVRTLLARGLTYYRQHLLSTIDNEAGDRGLSLTYFIGPAPTSDEEEELTEQANSDTAATLAASDGSSEDDEDEDEEPELTDEELAQMVRSLITGAARAYALGRTLLRLLNVTVCFEEKKRKRRLIFEKGILISSEDIGHSIVAESPPASSLHNGLQSFYRNRLDGPIDLVTYDRMRVLLAEIRRLHGRGHWISFNVR